jgi:hypothetical protein
VVVEVHIQATVVQLEGQAAEAEVDRVLLLAADKTGNLIPAAVAEVREQEVTGQEAPES